MLKFMGITKSRLSQLRNNQLRLFESTYLKGYSIKKVVEMEFKELWNNHPTVESLFDDVPCKVNGQRAFDNQCAIRMGQALIKSRVNLDSFRGVRCWHKHSPAHILRAEELAIWLKSAFSPVKQLITFEGVNGFDNIRGRKGIIFLRIITALEAWEII